jgi:hypothetical protein
MNPEQTLPPNQQAQNQPIPNQANTNDDFQTLIPTKNKPALLSYYFGVFGLIPILGLPLCVVAIILGKKGLSQYKATPTPGAKGHAIAGIVMGSIPLALFAIFLIFVVLARINSS